MVIPLGSMGPPLMGPPPQQLQGKFVMMKYCVIGMMVSLAGSLFFGIVRGGLADILVSSLNLILITIIGIFLLRDDPFFTPMYNFMLRTCCQGCADQCQGGMSCLMSFGFCNLISVVMQVVLSNSIGSVIGLFKLATTTGIGPFDALLLVILAMSLLTQLVSQIVATVLAWQAYNMARDLGVGMQGGDWGGGGGYSGGGAYSGGQATQSQSATREARPAAGFQPFSGGGNRLGS
mmetsp:Transcript_19742/g.54314  ORF Transcript_19742/g.54314 Transcript_19742/m.54314 type:complete len:234 (-) Transcript_19742:61-762(-)